MFYIHPPEDVSANTVQVQGYEQLLACKLRVWHTRGSGKCSSHWVHSIWQPLEPLATVLGVYVSKAVNCITSGLSFNTTVSDSLIYQYNLKIYLMTFRD